MEAVLANLPAPHRRFLIQSVNRFPPEIKTDEDRLKYVARSVDPFFLPYYRALYHRLGGVNDWIIDGRDDAVAPTLSSIWDDLRRRYPRAISGLKPRVEEHRPPQLHLINRLPGQIEMIYALWRKPQVVEDYYEQRLIQPVQFQRVGLRSLPFTIEMHHIAPSRQIPLAMTIAADIGMQIDQENLVQCRPRDTALQQRLETALDAIEVTVTWVGNGNRHLGHAAIGSDEKISVRQQADYLATVQDAHLREESRRTWIFHTRHPADGYLEKAYYDVMLVGGSYIGQVTASNDISDIAMRNLRRNVIGLF